MQRISFYWDFQNFPFLYGEKHFLDLVWPKHTLNSIRFNFVWPTKGCSPGFDSIAAMIAEFQPETCIPP